MEYQNSSLESSTEIIYHYKCPECGAKATSNLIYPFQRVTYDVSQKEMFSEAKVQESL